MMLTGRHTGADARHEPRVVQIQISRASRALPARGERLDFLVAIHVEGTAFMWQRNAALRPKAEAAMLERIDELRRWSVGMGLTADSARAAVVEVGTVLRDVFLGADGLDVLGQLRPTAIVLMVDETVIHLPWEMMLDAAGAPLVLTPFGRVVTVRGAIPPRRVLEAEDPCVKILAVENPTDDLPSAERVIEVIEAQRAASDGIEIVVTTLRAGDATRAGLAGAVRGSDFDIIHFAGHGRFDGRTPQDSSLVLADGPFTDEEVLSLEWSQPPFVVVNGSCESARSAANRRIVTAGRRSNGLAAAFLSRGVEAYLGNFFPVGDHAAAAFSESFYAAMLQQRNIGSAVQAAREQALDRYWSDAELTGMSVVFFGDSGTAERRDLATAV